jgi:hypothetical protein
METFLGHAQISIVRPSYVLDEAIRKKIHIAKKGKVGDFLPFFSFFFPFKFGSLSVCEKLLGSNRDFAARSELQGWNWQ